MAVDRDWMYDRLDDNGYLKTEYVVGVNNFIKFACQQDDFKQYQFLKCPCSNCWNKPYMEVESVKLHLYKSGYRENYSCWSCHGEAYIETQSSTSRSMSRASPNPYLDMVVDAYVPRIEVSVEESVAGDEEPPNDKIQQFYDMLKAAEKPLFDDCNTTLLEVAARITSLKCEFNIPHRAIDGFASLMKDTFPNGNVMTETFYATRKLVKGLELPHQKIDVCRKGCILYRKDYAHLERCPSCNADRFKPKANGKLISRRFLIYFPLKDRLQRIFALKSTAAHMSWHSENLRNDEVMIHPRDGEAWKSFDATYPNFAVDPRNVRLGLCTDGFSPFGKFGKSYSCWPVILTPYNLPPSMCMKRQNEEEQNEEDLFATLNGISNAHGNPTTDQVISPSGLWFDSTIVVQVITDGIQAYYDAPYTCWKNSSPIARDQWWRFFRDKFKWLPKHSDAVKVEFKKKAGHRIKDMANKASKVPSTKTIFWMSPDMRKKLKEVRSTVEFKKRSEQSLQNRMGGPKAGTKHCQGSISSMQIAKRMMKKNGQMPTASELFVKTHQRSKDKSFCDPRAEKLYKDFESDVVATQENGMVSDAVKNDIFIKHSGGFNRQGAVYGVGNGAALFYQRPSCLSKNLNQTQAVPSVVSQLEQQLKATTEELETTKSQLIKEKQKTDGHANDLVTQKKLIEGLYDALNSISQEMRRCAPSQFDD